MSSGRKGRLVAFSAPSGAGKSTICRMLLERHPDFRMSISATTRQRRDGEQDGVHYHFLTPAQFTDYISTDAFLEHEEVHGRLYGTLKASVEAMLEAGLTVLFDIDVKGALSIRRYDPRALLIFIKPPSLDVLRHRLKNRRTDDTQEIDKRLMRLEMEYELADEFDHIVVNDHLEETVAHVEKLILNHDP